MNFLVFLFEVPGLEIHIELLRQAYEKAARIPLALRVSVFGRKVIVFYLAIPNWLVYEVNTKRYSK